MKVAVCVATYRRPVMFTALLDSLAAVQLCPSAPTVILVVVENDLEGYAQQVVDERRATFPWPIISGVEPTRNIALARNRCVALALAENADWIAFVDDDEQVTPGWLAELLRVQAQYGADVVGGTAVNVYHAGAPAWITKAKLPQRTRYPTGTEVALAETSNVLISRRVFDLVPGHFDRRFGLGGGSDAHFFLRARRADAHIVWADDAIVHETFSPTRTTFGWLLRRAFRGGNASVFVGRAIHPLWRWLPWRIAATSYRLAKGTVFLIASPLRGRAAGTSALLDLSLVVGVIAALFGYHYIEYKQSHGA